MAARSVAADATLEQLRTTFNTLSATDFGDISALSSSISASNLVAAMNELESEVAPFAVGTITGATDLGGAPATTDSMLMNDGGVLKEMTIANLFTSPTIATPALTGNTSTTGNIIFEGATANSFETTLTVTDPTADRTITLPNATDTLVGKATTDTLTNKTLTTPVIEEIDSTGTITLDAATDIVLDAGGADIILKDDGTIFGGFSQAGGQLVIKSSSSSTTAITMSGAAVTIAGNLTVSGTTTTVDSTTVNLQTGFIFEGSTDNSFETTLTATDPTADRTITLPNLTGTVSLLTATETLTNKTLTSPTINGGTIAELSSLTFEGATANSFETTIAVTDPTADRTITLPNETFSLASFKNIVNQDGDGSTTTVTVANNPGHENQLFVFINGVCQDPANDYSLSSNTLTFGTAPESGDKIVVRY